LITNKFLNLYIAKLTKHTINIGILKKKISNILKYLIFLALGVFLFWLVYRDQDFSEIWGIITSKVNYSWILLMLVLGLISHVSRTLRWKIALEPLDEKPRTVNAFIAVMAGYFMNLLLPRMGEFVRCGMLSKYEKIPFSKLLGTVISERIIDVIMLGILVSLVFVFEFDKIASFGQQNPQVIENIKSIFNSPFLWGILALIVFSLFAYLYWNKKKGRTTKFKKIFNELAQGIKSILAMKRYKAYIAHSIFIWLMYFLMLYVAFFSLEYTSSLPIIAALVVFVMTSASMVAPVQAGLGAWHFMAEKGLSLYGIESTHGKIFALVAHSSMNLMILVCGAICIMLIPFVNRNYKPVNK
jgi:uncharacterized protein (TIRG00374 family)